MSCGTFRGLLFALLLSSGFAAEPKPAAAIDWLAWSDKIFERAKAEQKLVLLDLGAGWCHWCHVMDEQTYADPAVIALLREKYLAVRVDADARPDLANRYEDYGWPATVVFKWDGSELAKRRGYIPPKPMASMLQAFIDDPTPGPSVEPETAIVAASDAALSAEQRAAARQRFVEAYDTDRGGWGDVHHYLNWNAMEWCLVEGAAGDAAMAARARQTLTSGLKLIDPVWGGVYQYSTDGDWDHPHFEKIMPFQAENMRVFALAATLWREPKWLEPAQAIRRYLRDFLTSPEGAFYTSQDADVVQGEHSAEFFALDDAARRKRGIPRIDQHIYARENGLAITGLCALYAASGDASCLADARRAAEWVMKNRALPGGGFRHDEKDAAGPYLADTLAMARAFLALYTVTAERPWLARAQDAAAFIDAKFRAPLGFATASAAPAAPLPPKAQVDENIMLVRFANLLHHHTGDARWRAMGEHAMRFLAAPAIVDGQGFGTGGLLLADREFTTEPAHLTIVGGKGDEAARALFVAGLRGSSMTARIEWFDEREGPLPNSDVPLPKLTTPAAFLCANGSCSLPMRTPEQLSERLAATWSAAGSDSATPPSAMTSGGIGSPGPRGGKMTSPSSFMPAPTSPPHPPVMTPRCMRSRRARRAVLGCSEVNICRLPGTRSHLSPRAGPSVVRQALGHAWRD